MIRIDHPAISRFLLLYMGALLVIPLPGQASAQIYFLDWEVPPESDFPGPLPLVIESARPLYFKLILKNETIGAGMLTMGLNRIALPASELLQISGKYPLILEVRENEQSRRHEFEIRVLVEPKPPAQALTTPVIFHTRVAVYRQGALLAEKERERSVNPDMVKMVSVKGMVPVSVYSNKPGADAGSGGIPILALPFAIFKLIQQKKQEREDQQRFLESRKKKELSWTSRSGVSYRVAIGMPQKPILRFD